MIEILNNLKNINRKIWLIFWLIVLLLFMILCIFSKKDDFLNYKTQNIVKNQKVLQTEIIHQNTKEATKPIVKKPKVIKIVKKDINFKMVKEKDKFLISGVLASKNDYKALKKYYPKLVKNNLSYDKSRVNSKVLSIVIALRNIADKFKSGFMEYSNGMLQIDGVVNSQEEKDIIYLTLENIKGIKTSANIVVEAPKPKIKHIRKLSIVKVGDEVKISGTFASIEELNTLVNLFKNSGFKVRKELCVIDSDIKENRWEKPLFAVKDYFVKLIKGTMQFDNNMFYISGETNIEGLNQKIHDILYLNREDLKIEEDISYIKPKKMIEKIQEKVNSILKFKHIRFKKGTSEITDDTKPILDEVTKTLRLLPNLKIEIRGYTDSDGKAIDNLKLSQERAESVKQYLSKHGINEKNLFAIGFGEKNPIVENNSKENKQINRRVEFKIIGE